MPNNEFEGRSAAEAAIKACEQLGVTRSQLKYELLSDSGEGLDRRVVISVNADALPAPRENAAEPAHREPREDREPREHRSRGERSERGERGERGRRGGRGRGGRDRDGGQRPGPRQERTPQDQGDGIEALLNLEAVPTEPVQAKPEIRENLSERAVTGKDALQEIFRLSGWDAQAHVIADGEEEIHIDVRGGDPATLVGRKGEVLLSLQFLVNRLAARKTEGEQVIVLDVAGYRERRRAALADLATRLAKRAVEEKKVVRLSPMSAHDRRVFHVTLTELEGIDTRSEGTGLYRSLLIIPSEFAAG